MPSVSSMCSTTPGSSWPQRVPIGMPSSAVKPMVLARLRPASMAQSDGAVAEMRHHQPAGAERRVSSARRPAMYS